MGAICTNAADKTALAEKLGISRRLIHHCTGQLDRDLDGIEVRYEARPPVVRRIDPSGDR